MRSRSSSASRSESLVCPLCEVGQLRTVGHHAARCGSCSSSLNGGMLEALWQITNLPDCLGGHACECGHPEMRLLPDGTYHCPACGSEVLPAHVPSTTSKSEENGLAYWVGWPAASGREAASWTTRTWRGGRTHRTGLLTTGAIVRIAKPAKPEVIRTRRSKQGLEMRGANFEVELMKHRLVLTR
jgi:hypothetical protein